MEFQLIWASLLDDRVRLQRHIPLALMDKLLNVMVQYLKSLCGW